MLVLSRKKNESIVISGNITVVVVKIRDDKVRLGIEAPKEVPVHRREVFDAIHRNEASAGAVEEGILGRPRELDVNDGAKPAPASQSHHGKGGEGKIIAAE